MIRQHAYRGLAEARDDSALNLLAEGMKWGRPTQGRRAAAGALAQLMRGRRDREARDVRERIELLLVDKDFRVQAAALEALGVIGDPAAIVAALDGIVGRRFDVLRDLDRVRVTLDVTDDAAILDATLTPSSGAPGGAARSWVDGMKLGDASAALSLPASSALAVSFRDAEAARIEQAKNLETQVAAAVGTRLSAACG